VKEDARITTASGGVNLSNRKIAAGRVLGEQVVRACGGACRPGGSQDGEKLNNFNSNRRTSRFDCLVAQRA
jgi:hypothetical protein